MKILVATDLSIRADRAVARAFDLAGRLGGSVLALHTTDDSLPEEMAERLRADAEARLSRFDAAQKGAGEVANEARAVIGEPSDVIAETAEREGADLLVLGLHRPRFLADMVRETTMERITRRSPCPVLMVRDPADHPYGTLLAAVDFAPASTDALQLGARLAPGATIKALHVVHVPYHRFTAPAGQSDASAPFLKEARATRERWAADTALPEGMPEVEIREGAAESTILQEVSRLGANLLCVGAHGRVGGARALMGSIANDMMRAPPCDLLIAH